MAVSSLAPQPPLHCQPPLSPDRLEEGHPPQQINERKAEGLRVPGFTQGRTGGRPAPYIVYFSTEPGHVTGSVAALASSFQGRTMVAEIWPGLVLSWLSIFPSFSPAAGEATFTSVVEIP